MTLFDRRDTIMIGAITSIFNLAPQKLFIYSEVTARKILN